MAKKKKFLKKNWFKSTGITLFTVLGVFTILFFTVLGKYEYLDTIIKYGLGLTGSAVLLWMFSLLIPKVRKLIKL